jgi:N-methylhydantoinase A
VAIRSTSQALGLSVLDAAAGIREVADQQMADLLRQSTLERGYDPRDFCLFAYGGAGPVHACVFGREAGVRSIVIPVSAPVFSARIWQPTCGYRASDRFCSAAAATPRRAKRGWTAR